ncbi:MAG TPA: GntR family transcriptional regulator [Gemmatimonadales bacterium]|jgi:DNA-binding GntR family transcriptional regulator
MITRTPLRDQAYREIVELIHRGDLPPGTRVRDTTVASQLGISRTPVREALLRLAREGILAADMGRGFSVCRLDATEMRETGAILSALEGLALQSCGDIPAARLARLSEIDRELAGTRSDVDRCIALDEEWHRTLLEGCPNQRLRDIISTLWQVPRRYMRAYLRDARRVTLSTQHHARIIEALRRNDRETAARRFSHHWERGIEELGTWLER